MRQALGPCLLLLVWTALAPAQETASFRYGAAAEMRGVDLPAMPPTVQEGPVSEETYCLGPGDELEIGLWKEMDRRDLVRISPEGIGLVRPVGPIALAGLTLRQARDRIQSELGAYYRREDISVTLVTLRSFIVHVTGGANRPGDYEVSAIHRVSSVLSEAGGLAEGASSRNIRLVDAGGTSERVDLVAYQNAGDLSRNPFMMDGDVIHVPVMRSRVSVFGPVGRPGAYELAEDEVLGDIIPLCGGLLEGIDSSQVEVQRFAADDPSRSEKFLISLEEATERSPAGFLLADGDRIFFRRVTDWHRDASVELRGEFDRPGVYVIREGEERVLDVLHRAGGITSRAAPEEAKLLRTLFDSAALGVDKEIDFLVNEKTDRMTPEDYEFVKTYLREDTSRLVIDLESVLVQRDSTQNRLLRDGDIIIIPTRVDVVRVSGRVVSPGLVSYLPGQSYGEYVKKAGGYDRAADKGKVRVIKKRTGARLKPGPSVRIEPGDMIWVPPKEERDWWVFTKEVLAVAAQAATVYFVIDSTK